MWGWTGEGSGVPGLDRRPLRDASVVPLRCGGTRPQRRCPPAAADIPCAAYWSGSRNPRIEWKFQKGSSLVLFYYGGELTGTSPGNPPGSQHRTHPSVRPLDVPSPVSSLPAEPYKNRVQFSPTTIHFSTVTREDTGKYICEVVGDGGQIAKSEVNLIVQGTAAPTPPPPPSLLG